MDRLRRLLNSTLNDYFLMTSDCFAGMTVNERIFVCGVMGDFDRAAKICDKEKIIEILLKVDLTEEQAARTAENILSDPARYGY